MAEFLCGPIESVGGAVLATYVTERHLPVGAVVGHALAAVSDETEPVENEDLVSFTARFASGATATLSASRTSFGHPNGLGFEVFAEKGSATFELARASEFGFVDGTAPLATQGYRQVLVGPEHPYITGGLPMDFPGVGHGQNDLFAFQARAFLEPGGRCRGTPALPDLRGRTAQPAAAGRRCHLGPDRRRGRHHRLIRKDHHHEARCLHGLPARPAHRRGA